MKRLDKPGISFFVAEDGTAVREVIAFDLQADSTLFKNSYYASLRQ
jgi:hypothetical protein